MFDDLPDGAWLEMRPDVLDFSQPEPDAARPERPARKCYRHDSFWARVVKGPACWEWTGHRNTPFGYGRVTIGGRRMLAHRRAWQLLRGDIPDGLYALHRCDNALCVRPSHLFLGTLADNAHDRDTKGRTSRGDRHAATVPVRQGAAVGSMTKLTEAQVAEMRSLYTGRYGQQKELAEQFGIDRTWAHRILRGEVWRHVG